MRSSRGVQPGAIQKPAADQERPRRRGRMPSVGRRRQDRLKEEPMAATAPETTPAAPGWLDPFLEDWRPGSGAPIEDREPATGIHLLTIAGSTPGDVARASAAAAAAQPAWADTDYQERARILRRAADIYEAHRPEFGTWTQLETGAVHGKMHHK